MLGIQALGPVLPRRAAEAGAGKSESGAVCGVDAASVALEAASGIVPTSMTAGESAAGGTRYDNQAALERDAWVDLLSVAGLGPVSFGALLTAFGSARAVLHAAVAPGGPERLLQAMADAAEDRAHWDSEAPMEEPGGSTGDPVPGGGLPLRGRSVIGMDLARRICEAAASDGKASCQVRALGLTVVTLEEEAYPDRLRRVDLPPPLLYVRGSTAALAAEASVAVVGTRRPTDKGRLIAAWIGSAIARAGGVVVSGLAVGIDGAAHAAVVAEGGPTVAVLGGGHARLFPRAHERLADAIVESGGAVVSELGPQVCPSRGTFPRRNRLVSGLSDATVVVEAGRRSGALITAGWALEQGRECFVVPGAFDSPASAGCHAFLRSFPGQARVVCGIAELIEDLELDRLSGAQLSASDLASPPPATSLRGTPTSSPPGAGRAAVIASLGPVERALAQELSRGPATADQLSLRTSLAAAAVLSALTLLELRGLATGAYGRYSPAGPLAGWSGDRGARHS